MPRPARMAVADVAYHVLNRGNGKATVFHDAEDYAAFVGLLGEASDRVKGSGTFYAPSNVWTRGVGALATHKQWCLTPLPETRRAPPSSPRLRLKGVRLLFIARRT